MSGDRSAAKPVVRRCRKHASDAESEAILDAAKRIIGEFAMARARKKKSRPAPWTRTHVALMRRLAGRVSTRRIARQLKRSEAAVRFKAHKIALSLRLR